MASLTHIFILFGLYVILTECTLHHGLHHGMMGMPMYGSPYLYPGMGVGMYHGGPMMYGMGPGLMHFSEDKDAEVDNTENAKRITPEKTENLTPFQEHNDHERGKMNMGSSGKLISFKDDADLQVKSYEPTTKSDKLLVKREVAKSDDKNPTSDLPIIFPNECVEKIPEKIEKAKENAATESSIHTDDSHEATDKLVSEKDTPELARNSDYLMIPVVQAASPILMDSYDNQRDIATSLAANSQSINQGLDRQGIIPNFNSYQPNIQTQVPMYGNQVNNGNGVPQNYNVIPVNNNGNTLGALTLVTLPNNLGPQAGNVPNNQYYANTVPQNIMNRAGIQNTPSYNVVPMNQPQRNFIGFLAQPNTIPLTNQYINGIPINNKLVNMAPINNQPNNVLPVSNYIPANSYVLVNNLQNVEPLPNQAGLNAWNVPVGNQPLNYDQHPQTYSQQPQIYNQQPQVYNQQPLIYSQQPLNQQPNGVMLTGQPNADTSLAQGSLVPNESLPVTEYVPVYNTKDKVDEK